VTPTNTEIRAARDTWRRDPVRFFREVLGDKPEPHQIQIIEAVRDHRETSVASCHGPGKDWTAGRLALWFAVCYPPAWVITTAPSARQVEDILWKEIRIAHRDALVDLGGEFLPKAPELSWSVDHKMIGFKASDYDEDRWQGRHERNILVILDEASGISQAVENGLAGCLTSSNAKLVRIGNPLDAASPFGRSFKDPECKKIRISAFDTSNFLQLGIGREQIQDGSWRDIEADWIATHGKLPNDKLVTPWWVAKYSAKWGWDSPLTVAKILGRFPDSSDDVLVPLSWYEQAKERTIDALPTDPLVLGLDVADRGTAFSSCYRRHGGFLRRLWRKNGALTPEIVGRVLQEQRDGSVWAARDGVTYSDASDKTAGEIVPTAAVDAVGVGAGVYNMLEEAGAPCARMMAGASPRDKERFPSASAEWAWSFRERFRPDVAAIDVDPADEELEAQATSRRWAPDSRGRVKLESKDEMAKRGIPSPDDLDAAILAFATNGETGLGFGASAGFGLKDLLVTRGADFGL